MSGLEKSILPIKTVTTFNQNGFKAYAYRMLKSYAEHWPKEVELIVYPEDATGLPKASNIAYRDFPDWFPPWKESLKDCRGAHGNDPKHNRRGVKHDFRYDCVRFSHKIAAITDIAMETKQGWLIWLDADIYTHADISIDWLYSLHPGTQYMAWLSRYKTHPECGFMIFNCEHPFHMEFMTELRDVYESKRVFNLKETHDSYVTQQIVLGFVKAGKMEMPYNLSGKHDTYHHPFIRSELGSRMDHMKGPRKRQGASPHVEVGRFRREEYWTKPAKRRVSHHHERG